MAAVDPPAGLMDIVNTITPDEIPFKLRCAICNKLALNAFRLPCCDQSTCEACQASLHDTCPVCAHTPVSPDLCKPNKALRTTLKAFLRTEEKKREKDRQAAVPPTPPVQVPTPAPAENDAASVEIRNEDTTTNQPPVGDPSVGQMNADNVLKEDTIGDPQHSAVNASALEPSQVSPSDLTNGHAEEPGNDTEAVPPPADDVPAESESAPQDRSTPDPSTTSLSHGGFPGMGWNNNPSYSGMNPFMGNPMFNFQNPMGMPMTMDPMAANQGMFGDYGMNMTGMGMNMGMNFNGQGMYGSIGWDGSQQNMWRGQDKFNPNAFANGTGPPYGGAFGGSNMSYHTNGDFHSGYQGYGRGGYGGRGRGHFQGPGRGGFHHAHSASTSKQPIAEVNEASLVPDAEIAPGSHDVHGNDESNPVDQTATGNAGQLQGIPTIDSLDQAMPTGPTSYQGASGYGRGDYMRGSGFGARGTYGGSSMGGHQPYIEPKGPGVEGAPAAPRAMRQGLPNTSVFRQRGFQNPGRASSISSTLPAQSANLEALQTQPSTNSPSKAPSQAPQADPQTRSASRSRSRSRSPTIRGAEEDISRRDRKTRRTDDALNGQKNEDRSGSPSQLSSRRSSRRRHHDSDRERRGHRSTRSRRHGRSRSGTPNKNGPTRYTDNLGLVTEDKEPKGSTKQSSGIGDSRGLASRVDDSHRSSRDRPSQREEDRTRARDSQQRHRDRDRDSDRDRRRDRDRARDGDRDRVRERERDRGRGRKSDRKRSRRDRSESGNVSEHSHSQSRRAKRAREDRERDRHRRPAATEPEKDPHTLEREARNRERLLREKQRREQASSGSRRDGRQERIVAGRRINFKYEDEL